MTVRARKLTLVGIVVAAAAATGVFAARDLWSPPLGVPLHTVAEQPFRRRVVAEGVLKPADATPITVPGEVFGAVRIAWMVEEGAAVAAGEPVVRLDPTELERQRVAAEEDRTSADLKLGKATAEAGAARRNLERDADLAAAELAHAEGFAKKDEQVFSRVEIVESEVDRDLAEQRREHAESERSIRERLAATEAALVGVERQKADIALERAETGLRLLEVVAPHAGFVTRHRDWRGVKVNEGDTVWRGQKLGEIPNLARLQAEVWVLEADAGGLQPGQTAVITVEGQAGAPLKGKVERVQSVAQPRIPGSPVQYFGVTLALDGPPPPALKVGHRVRAELALEDRAAAIVVPRQAVFEVEGESVVYRLRDGELEAVAVTLGPMAAGRAVVTAGLAAGDRIALADPKAAADAAATPAPGGAGPSLPGAAAR